MITKITISVGGMMRHAQEFPAARGDSGFFRRGVRRIWSAWIAQPIVPGDAFGVRDRRALSDVPRVRAARGCSGDRTLRANTIAARRRLVVLGRHPDLLWKSVCPRADWDRDVRRDNAHRRSGTAHRMGVPGVFRGVVVTRGPQSLGVLCDLYLLYLLRRRYAAAAA